MFADERQKIIYEHIREKGAVTTGALMEEFDVSIETVRRDLLAMERRGLLKRVHGGAVAMPEMKLVNGLKERNKEYVKEKRELSVNAATYVNEKDILFVDAGSTAIHFTEILKERFSNLTVITHSLDVFNILCGYKDFEVILCGGRFNKDENAFYGSMVLDTLSRIYVHKAFIFPTAVSMEFGMCDYNEELAQIQKQIFKYAEKIYVMADSGKFEKKALLKIEDMKKEYQYITDSNLPDELEILYKENGINIFSGNIK